MLKPQDILVLLKLALYEGKTWSYGELGHALGMSPSEVHAAVRRAVHSGLVKREGLSVNRTALLEFLVHGLRYVFAPERGGLTRGMPTSYAAPPLRDVIDADGPLPVWPDPNGDVRGEAFEPLYRSAVKAARQDQKLYECLALVDAIRGGRARERSIAEHRLREILHMR